MAIRSDVSIDWSASPRLLTIAAPSTEITVQDIVDTCRYLEDLSPNASRKKLIDAAGKEFLGGTTYVGITATLQNAVIAFEARPAPNWILCTMSGGNLVAIDDLGAIIDPRHPTAFVTVDRTASASATMQEQSALQYSSFGNKVTINPTSGTGGTTYPIGTIESPVDNIPDALLIATSRGFHTLYFQESMTITGVDITGYTIIGASCIHTQIIIDPSAVCTQISIKDCDVSGTIDGEIKVHDCLVGDLANVNGAIFSSCLYGTIALGGAADSNIANCFMRNLSQMPAIDMGGSGQNLFLSDWSGGIKVRNMTGPTNYIGCQLDGGKVFVEATVSAGMVGIVGIGTIVDASTGTANVDTTGLVNNHDIHSGTARGASTQNITLATTASSDDGVYDRNIVVIVDKTGIGQTRTIVEYDGLTKVATVDRDWRVQPDNTSVYRVTADNAPVVNDHGMAQGGTSNTITIHAYASSVDDTYINSIITIAGGTGRGQARLVDSYNGLTKVITIQGENWSTIPDATSVYAMVPFGVTSVGKIKTDALDQMGAAIWDRVLTGATHNIPSSAGRRLREIGAYAIHSGTAQGGDAHSITLAATASLDSGIYNRNLIVLTDNTGAGQTRTIIDYDGITKIAIIDRDWRILPDGTTAYQITPNNVPLVDDQGVARGGTASTITIRNYASPTDDAYLYNIIAIIGGTGRGQARLVDSYDGITNVITIQGDDWSTIPDTTSVYVMLPYGAACAADIAPGALDKIGDAVWAKDLSTYTISGTAGKIMSTIKKTVDAIIAYVS